ncbi:hypothetical protein BDF14DRAFT_946925 [Spinellus fusiger]|nr:hypothetical protein BDF14DRAFT_946925 [Spinellus fusiger]
MAFGCLQTRLLHLLQDKQVTEDVALCGASVRELFASTAQCLAQKNTTSAMNKAVALTDLAHETLLLFPYRHVPVHWRCLLMDATLLKTACQLHSLDVCPDPVVARQLIADMDTAMIVSGAPVDTRRTVAHEVVDQLQQWLSSQRPPPISSPFPLSSNTVTPLHPLAYCPGLPSYTGFSQHVYTDQGPCLFPVGAVDHWPAFSTHPWTHPDYLLSVAADRVVPIELGRTYTDSDWQQTMMRWEDFIHTCVVGSTALGYLAQHDLFHQIPRLANDIQVPDYCFVCPPVTAFYTPPQQVIQNAWFGPANTMTPLHHDPYHNILVQVVGRKYIRLYAPGESCSLYPHDGLLENTSQVDVQHPDLSAYPLFEKAVFVDCVLNPGEMLYIPPLWWHSVQSLDISFSVSFWF